MQVEILGVYKIWQNEKAIITLGVCSHLFTFHLDLLNGAKTLLFVHYSCHFKMFYKKTNAVSRIGFSFLGY